MVYSVLHGEQQTSTSGLLCAFDDAEYFNINDLRRYLSRKNITLNGKVSFLAVQYSQKWMLWRKSKFSNERLFRVPSTHLKLHIHYFFTICCLHYTQKNMTFSGKIVFWKWVFFSLCATLSKLNVVPRDGCRPYRKLESSNGMFLPVALTHLNLYKLIDDSKWLPKWMETISPKLWP